MQKKKATDKNLIRKAFLDTLPVMAGYLVLGMGFGIILKTKGYGFIWSLLMSGLIYAGSMQYLAVDLLAGGAGLITAALTTLMVNARHLFYSISMVEKYKDAGRRKPYMVFALTDETYSLVCKDDVPAGEEGRTYCFLVSVFDQIYWVGGSLLGSLLGSVLKINTTGIDFALTALFVTVFTDQWLSAKDHKPAIIGVVASVICLLIFGADSFLIPSMILITVALTVCRKYIKEGQ